MIEVPIVGDEIQVTDEMRARTVWALRRYSSVIYGRRMYDLLKGFIGGLEDWARAQRTPTDVAFAREILRMLYAQQGDLENALDRIKRGRKKAGYYDLLQHGLDAFTYINGRRFDDGMFWEFIGWKNWGVGTTGLFSWAEGASNMSDRVRKTLEAAWTYEELFGLNPRGGNWLAAKEFPANLPVAPPVDPKLTFKTGDRVPFTGIFLPTSFPGACPNFLVEDWKVPQASRTSMRRDYLDAQGLVDRSQSMFYAQQIDAVWQPLWRDDRYGWRATPDPPEYLNSETEFPPYPPRYFPPS
jgi:hypothetical protein